MKMILMVGLVLALGASAHAAGGVAVGAGGGKKAVSRMLDANGNPIVFNDDKPWKVFAFEFQTTPAQLVDEAGVAPKQGLIKRVCLESGPAVVAANDWAIVWDTLTASNMTAGGAGHRVAPPLVRVASATYCLEINAEFTSGAGVMQGLSAGSTYIYWRELGGYK